MVRHRKFFSVLTLLIAVLSFTACTIGQSGQSDSNSLVIYSGRSETLVEPIIAQFEADTGIDVEVRYGTTAEMAAMIIAEGNDSQADLFFAQDPGGLGTLAEAGYFMQLPDETLNKVTDRFKGPNGEWIGISGRARVVVFNTSNVAPSELPVTIEGFTEPQWQGRIGWAPSNGSFQAMVTAMRSVWGEEKTQAWLEGIIANNPVSYSGNTAIVEGVGKGEVDIGFVNHYYLFRFLEDQGVGFPVRNYFIPDGSPASLIMVSGAGVLESSNNQENAIRFIDYLLSNEGQEYFTAETFEYPVVLGIKTEDLLTPLRQLDTFAIDIDPALMADLDGTVALLDNLELLD